MVVKTCLKSADVFLHTWQQLVATKERSRVLAFYNPVAYEIDPLRNFSDLYSPFVRHLNCTRGSTGELCADQLQNKFSMFWGLKRVAELMRAHEKQRGCIYTFAINLRFDLHLSPGCTPVQSWAPRANLSAEHQDNTVYALLHSAHPPLRPREVLDDRLFGGSSAVIAGSGKIFDYLSAFLLPNASQPIPERFELSNHINLEKGLQTALELTSLRVSPICSAIDPCPLKIGISRAWSAA